MITVFTDRGPIFINEAHFETVTYDAVEGVVQAVPFRAIPDHACTQYPFGETRYYNTPQTFKDVVGIAYDSNGSNVHYGFDEKHPRG